MLPGWTGMLSGDRAAFHFVYWHPVWDLFYTSDSDARELNHDAGNSATGGGYSGRGAHRHCHPETQRQEEARRRRILVRNALRRTLILACREASPPADRNSCRSEERRVAEE